MFGAKYPVARLHQPDCSGWMTSDELSQPALRFSGSSPAGCTSEAPADRYRMAHVHRHGDAEGNFALVRTCVSEPRRQDHHRQYGRQETPSISPGPFCSPAGCTLCLSPGPTRRSGRRACWARRNRLRRRLLRNQRPPFDIVGFENPAAVIVVRGHHDAPAGNALAFALGQFLAAAISWSQFWRLVGVEARFLELLLVVVKQRRRILKRHAVNLLVDDRVGMQMPRRTAP